MRGRTNTDLYSGISLNATTDEFEVSGGNVVAGDFVQYKYASAERKQLALDHIGTNVCYYKISNDLYLSSTGILYELSDGNLIVKDSAENESLYVAHIVGNKYALGCIESTTLIVEIDIVNKTITTLSKIISPVSTSSERGIIALAIVGSNHNRLVRWSYSTSSTSSSTGTKYHNTYYVYDISDLENVTLIAKHEDESSSGSTARFTLTRYLCSYGNKFVFANNSRVTSITFDETTDDFARDSYGYVDYATSPSYFGVNGTWAYTPNNLYNNRFIPVIISGTGSTIFLFVVDISDLSFSTNNLWQGELIVETRSYSTSSSKRGIGISEVDSNGNFYISSAPNGTEIDYGIGFSRACITPSGGITISGTKVSFYPHSSIIYTPITPINNGDEGLIILYPTSSGTAEGNGTYYYNANVINGDIIIGEQQDVVEPYDGSNPKMLMGVAATSGQVGDTIDVYVPLANT